MMGAVLAAGNGAPNVPLAAPSPRKRMWHHLVPEDAARNGRGDYRSPKSLRRERESRAHGVTSGRQWVRLRKKLQRAAKAGVA